MSSNKNAHENQNQIILIVEDHDALRSSLQKWLGAVFPACTFLEARDGEEAIFLVDERHPRIVIMDIKLPGINGIEVVRQIKNAAPGICIVMLSMYDASEYRSASESAGASAYVPKHKMYTDLVPVLKKLMRDQEDDALIPHK